MTSSEHLRRRLLPMTLPVVLTLVLAGFAPAQSTTKSSPAGRIVEAPADIGRFSPRETSEAVDASRVELRQVLEDLGPLAIKWYMHTTTLADPFFEGRVASTRGMELAGEYIAFHFQRYGLDPAFPEGDADHWTSYFQPFDIAARRGPRQAVVKKASLSIDGHEATFEEDFVIFGNSGSGRVEAPVTFVGYGILEGEDDYSSFEKNADLSGRIALVLRYEPLDESGESRWSDDGFSRHSSLRRKLKRLSKLGAEAILVVNPPGAADGRTGLDSIERSSRLGSVMGIPVAQITPELADDLLIQADPRSRDLSTLRQLADRGEISTIDLDDDLAITIVTDVDRNARTTAYPGRNCGGVLRGRGTLAEEWLVIGGHYDHVGNGQLSGAMPGNSGQVHPGADDNASGTAGVMVLAEQLAKTYADEPEDADLRSVLFLAFDGEEQGLLGSRHYTDHPTIDPRQITAMLNFDMIGRLRDNNLLVLGSGTADGFEDLLLPHIEASGLTVSLGASSSGRSDEANFIAKKIPGLHFFTGMTPEYHSPHDEYHTVDPRGAAIILEFALNLATDLATRDEKLEFTEPGQQRTESRNYAKVRLGIRPGMGADLDTGVLVEGVSLDTSAADAGITEGDILLSWDGEPLESTRDLFTVLQNHKPGDVVKIKILRDGKEVTLDVRLKAGE